MPPFVALMIDFESRSEVNLKHASYRKYASHPSFGVMCLGLQAIFSANQVSEPVVQTPFRGGPVFERGYDHCHYLIGYAILHNIPIYAHNVTFDRAVYEYHCVKVLGWPEIPRHLWRCTLALCSYYTLPRKLEQALLALKMPVQKDKEGNKLMLKYSKPRPWTAKQIEKKLANNEPIETRWWDKPEDFRRIYQYCKTDIVAQTMLLQRLQPLPPARRVEWQFDQTMNRKGVPVDLEGLKIAADLLDRSMHRANARLAELTAMPGCPGGVVTSVMQTKAIPEWTAAQGVHLPNVKKETIEQFLSWPDLPPQVKEVLHIRSLAGKASIAKVEAMLEQVDDDARIRDGIVWHGAATGRYAGRGVQWHNFPRDCMKPKDAEEFHEIIRRSSDPFAELRDRFSPDSPDPLIAFPDILSTALRSFIQRHDGLPLFVSDFSSIEARVTAWMSGCKLLLAVFERGECPYCQFASIAFHKEVQKGMPERQLGKVAVLGLGYGMGADKFIQTAGAPPYNVPLDQRQSKYIVDLFRDTYPEIPAFWRAAENAFKTAVKTRGQVDFRGLLRFACSGDWACIRLPSGRCIWYCQPTIIRAPSRFKENQTTEVIQYWSVDSVKKIWVRTTTYGGSIVENIVQAVAADLLNAAMHRTEQAGYNVILSVHDEVICEPPPGMTLDGYHKLMKARPDWASDCPIDAESHEMIRYGK